MEKYYWNYKSPDGFTDMIMFSDGRFLTGLVFEKSADGFTNRWEKIRGSGSVLRSEAESCRGFFCDECVCGDFALESILPSDHENKPDRESGLKRKLLPVFEDTMLWLDQYFGKDPKTGEFTGISLQPDFIPAIKIDGITPFRKKVITAMLSIPYGQTMTYGEIAKLCGKEKMSARAVGGAVGWNPICLIIPCHRVLGTNGSITGYGGGIQNKIALLHLEGAML